MQAYMAADESAIEQLLSLAAAHCRLSCRPEDGRRSPEFVQLADLHELPGATLRLDGDVHGALGIDPLVLPNLALNSIDASSSPSGSRC